MPMKGNRPRRPLATASSGKRMSRGQPRQEVCGSTSAARKTAPESPDRSGLSLLAPRASSTGKPLSAIRRNTVQAHRPSEVGPSAGQRLVRRERRSA